MFLVQVGQVAVLEQRRVWLVESVQSLSQLHMKTNNIVQLRVDSGDASFGVVSAF